MRTLPSELISLLQYVELNKSNWWDETVDRSVLAILWLDRTPYAPQKIKHELENRLGFKVRLNEVQASVKRLSEQEMIVTDNVGRFNLTIEQRSTLNSQVDSSKNLEIAVIKEFNTIVGPSCKEIDPNVLWQEFKLKFIIPLVADLGIRVYEFFTKKRQDLPWISFLDNFLGIVPENCQTEIRSVISTFMSPDNEELSLFILSYLDAYLLVSAYGLSTQTIQSLKRVSEENVEFIVFLDTNVIFSLLDLHTNPSNETVGQLMELVSSIEESIKISFVVSPITLKETQDAIQYYRDQLVGTEFPLNLAEAAKIIGVSGVYRRFFDRVKDVGHSINVVDYFDPYLNQMVPFLNSKSVSIFTEPAISDYEKLPKVYSDIDYQKKYEDEKHKSDAKGIDQITKDVVLWHFVQDQRKPRTTSPLLAKYWVLTIDYRFLSFDRFKKKGSELISVCIHPSQLIQLLRFFIPSTPQIGKILLGTIITPLISRGLNGKAELTVLKILKRLSRYEGIEDVPVDVISRLLADENLRSKLEKQHDEEKEDEILRERFALELAQASKEVQEQAKVIQTQDQQLNILKEDYDQLLSTSSEQVISLSRKLDEQQRVINGLVTTKKDEEEKSAKRKAVSDFRKTMLVFFVPYFIFIPLTWIGLSSIPMITQIPWLHYGLFATILVILTVLSMWFVTSQGNKDKYISIENWFITFNKKVSISALLWFALSFGWSLLIDYFKSLVIP